MTIVLAAAVAAVLAACGGGGSKQLSRAQAVAVIDPLCQRQVVAEDRARSLAPHGRHDDARTQLTRLRAAVRSEDELSAQVAKLRLGGPSRAAAAWVATLNRDKQLRHQLLQYFESRLRTFAPNFRSPELNLLNSRRAQAISASHRAAGAAGLRDCGGGYLDAQAAVSPVGPGSLPSRVAGGQAIQPGSGFVGTWQGLITQSGPGATNLTYPAIMTIDPRPSAGGVNGHTAYPANGCSGSVHIFRVGTQVGYRYTLRENIESGQNKCAPGAEITAVVQGDELDWRWRHNGIQAAGILKLQGAPSRPAIPADAIRQVQGGQYWGAVTQYGPRGETGTYRVQLGIYAPHQPHYTPAFPSPRPPNNAPSVTDVFGGNIDGYTLYPDSPPGPCVGQLKIESASGDRAVLREHITQGNCFDNGRVETRLVNGNQLLFRWFDQHAGPAAQPRDTIVLGTLSASVAKVHRANKAD